MRYSNGVDLQFSGIIEFNTAKAILFQDWFWNEPQWFPRSQITVTQVFEEDEVTITASEWICGKNDLVESFGPLFVYLEPDTTPSGVEDNGENTT